MENEAAKDGKHQLVFLIHICVQQNKKEASIQNNYPQPPHVLQPMLITPTDTR